MTRYCSIILFVLVSLYVSDALKPQGSGVDPEGGAILIGQRVAGVVDNNSDADIFWFQGVAGESVRIEANATSGGLDPAVTLLHDAFPDPSPIPPLPSP